MKAKKHRKTKQKKILPTINFLDPYSIKSWGNMREIFLSYGKEYLYRFELFMSISFIFILLKLLYEIQQYVMADEISKATIVLPQIIY